MKQFATLLALVAYTEAARCRLEQSDCDTGFTADMDECECVCQTTCDAPETLDEATCSCGCGDLACDEEGWALNAEMCNCGPAEGQDPCDPMYGGNYQQADGTDCPVTDGGDGDGSGAIRLAATAAALVAATLMF